jgi:hypothetical protein
MNALSKTNRDILDRWLSFFPKRREKMLSILVVPLTVRKGYYPSCLYAHHFTMDLLRHLDAFLHEKEPALLLIRGPTETDVCELLIDIENRACGIHGAYLLSVITPDRFFREPGDHSYLFDGIIDYVEMGKDGRRKITPTKCRRNLLGTSVLSEDQLRETMARVPEPFRRRIVVLSLPL